MQAYVINLLDRLDRWSHVETQESKLVFGISRVDAISINSELMEREKFTAPGVAATWKSHQKAMAQFLESKDDFGLIMEDDFKVLRPNMFEFEKYMEVLKLDFLQLGYLTPHFLDGFFIRLANIQDTILKCFSKILPLSRYLNSKHLILEQVGVPRKIVLNDIRAGGQAYIVSRNFASAAQSMNTPVFLSTDGLFMALGVSRNFRMARLRRMWISQTNSPSSVTQRFKS